MSEKALDFSALSALNLPEIKVNNEGNTVVVKETIQEPKQKTKPDPIKEEDIQEPFSVGEVDSIEDIDAVIDITEIHKNKNKFKTVTEDDTSANDDSIDSTNDQDYFDEENTQEDPYTAYGVWLKENSIMDYDEEEFNKAKDKNEFLIKKEIEKFESAVQEYKDSHSPYIKQLIELDDQGIDIEKILQHDAKIQSYEKISIEKLKEDENLQKQVVTDYLRRQGDSEEEIRETIEELSDNLTLDKKAEKYFPKLRDAEIKERQAYIKQEEAQRKAAEKAYEASLKETKQYIDKLDNLLPNIPLTKADKEGIFNNLTKTDPRTGLTGLQKAAQKDPIKFNAIISYLAMKDFNFEDLFKAAKTAVAKDVKNKITTTTKVVPNTNVNLGIFKKVLKK